MKNFLKKALWAWMMVVRPIGLLQSKILFATVYLIVFLPLGIISSIFMDPLSLKKKHPSWKVRADNLDSLNSLKKQ